MEFELTYEFASDGRLNYWRALNWLGVGIATESAEALAIRQAGEDSVVGAISTSVTFSMNAVLRWVYWWHSTENKPEDRSSSEWSFADNCHSACLPMKPNGRLSVAMRRGILDCLLERAQKEFDGALIAEE